MTTLNFKLLKYHKHYEHPEQLNENLLRDPLSASILTHKIKIKLQVISEVRDNVQWAQPPCIVRNNTSLSRTLHCKSNQTKNRSDLTGPGKLAIKVMARLLKS